jgi:ketosteroid isomerase-like protein
LVERYAAAVSARDVDAVVSLFAEGAVQRDPATAPPNVGREAIATFLGNGVGASTATLFEPLAVHTAGDHVAIDFKVTVTLGTGTMVIEGIEVFTVDADGLIAGVTAYWDDADVTFAER